MHANRAVDAELRRSLGLSLKDLAPLLAAGGESAESKFMECCWCLWKANGVELAEALWRPNSTICPKNRALSFSNEC